MISTRSLEPELLDGNGHGPDEHARSLAAVARVNRRLGGIRALHRHLAPVVARRPRSLVLDVGTGNGETLDGVVGWARRRGAAWRGVGVERDGRAVRAAAGACRSPLVRADALRLPFRPGSFDVVLCTLTLHHFDDAGALALLGEARRVARELVVVNDLERSRWNHLGARLLAVTVWRGDRLTRHDGPLSVLRSFTSAELAALGEEAGLEDVRVRRHFPWRLVLEGRP